MIEYRIEFGSYYTYENDRMVRMLMHPPAVGFVVEDGEVCFFKHGELPGIEAWARKQAASAEEINAPDWGKVIILSSDKFPVEDLNKCVATSGRHCLELLRQIQQNDGQADLPPNSVDVG